MKHRHTWTIVEKVEHESPAEMDAKHGLRLSQLSGTGYINEYYARPVIVTYKCYDCPAEKVERV